MTKNQETIDDIDADDPEDPFRRLKEPFRILLELFIEDLKEQPNVIEHFPCEIRDKDKSKTIQLSVQWEEIYSSQSEAHKTIGEYIHNKQAIVMNAMNHYRYIEEKYGKAELEELILDTVTDLSKTSKGQRLTKFIDEQMSYNLPMTDVFFENWNDPRQSDPPVRS